MVRKTDKGWELEADLRHAEFIVKQLGLQDGSSVTTPGVAAAGPRRDDEHDEDELLAPADAFLCSAIAARCDYLQPHRHDIQFAVKEACRMISSPAVSAWERLKRIGRCLKGRPRLIWEYNWQSEVDVIDAHSDANWAGCKSARKSFSGGTISFGGDLI